MEERVCGNYHSHSIKLVAPCESLNVATMTVIREISCRMENIFVATITVDQEISCHTVQIVTETTMSAFILHFEKQLPRSRVQWQLS